MQGRRSLVCLTLMAALLTAMTPAVAQVGFDRPGRDYGSFVVRSGDPAVCAQRCDHDQRCRAWAFAYPPTAGAPALCWLKAEVPARVQHDCCISGVRGAGVIEPPISSIEFSIDRVGGDYRNFETVPNAIGKTCADACWADQRCRAWTYARPGYQGPARCWLKDRLTMPRRVPCCVSGVVR